MKNGKHSVIDLFSGAGGMSFGFHRHPNFELIGAADAEKGKPSTGNGKLQCNVTYQKNIGIEPCSVDLSEIKPSQLRSVLGISNDFSPSVLSACPPCTGFSRANPDNHLRDDYRNSLVRKSAEFAVELRAKIVVMENARELLQGNFSHHFDWFKLYLEKNGYRVFAKNYLLSRFGLPQIRERAIVIAVSNDHPMLTMDHLWSGVRVDSKATTVSRAFDSIPSNCSALNSYPDFSSDKVRRRIAAIPANGGSWIDLLDRDDADELLTDAMKRLVSRKKLGSYPDVYGRLQWDKPAPTIKRECAHVGNGRYAHPEENRLCSIREIAALQGFPHDFIFEGAALSNLYRHIGDAVPPLISFQMANLVDWIFSRKKPELSNIVLANTNLTENDFNLEEELTLTHA